MYLADSVSWKALRVFAFQRLFSLFAQTWLTEPLATDAILGVPLADSARFYALAEPFQQHVAKFVFTYRNSLSPAFLSSAN